MGVWRQKEVIYIQGKKKKIQLNVRSQVNTHSSYYIKSETNVHCQNLQKIFSLFFLVF